MADVEWPGVTKVYRVGWGAVRRAEEKAAAPPAPGLRDVSLAAEDGKIPTLLGPFRAAMNRGVPPVVARNSLLLGPVVSVSLCY
ncbi:MAG: hypothetical protein HZA54_05565 [Planctomycetes bacterium]|nr:hypothetical protein [Planctomycetota bacterium]